ncbi:hypothetical protein E4U21_006164 [Claviceps maximensis]|nr:hypothetical protein E4U21_006164 [Claviceps maximensis]
MSNEVYTTLLCKNLLVRRPIPRLDTAWRVARPCGQSQHPRRLDKEEQMARDATSKGATTLLGRGLRDHAESGYFMDPTILTGVKDDMLMSQDETFAPLLGVSLRHRR